MDTEIKKEIEKEVNMESTYTAKEVINLLFDINKQIEITSGGLALGERSFKQYVIKELK